VIGAPAAAPAVDAPAASGPRRLVSPAAVLLACCLLLALLPFLTAPGAIIADSKLDLAINPVGYLARAFSLWDAQQFGQHLAGWRRCRPGSRSDCGSAPC
jgi:arabinofuranan 3-O-arabinosyltransferase